MSYASQSGRARTSSRNPQAFAVCARCGMWYNRVNLQFQRAWRGAQIQDTYILVCKPCYDTPNEQLRAISLPADPVPISFPSPEDFANAETDYRAVAFAPTTDPRTGIPVYPDDLRVTEDCQNRTLIPYGAPDGLDQNAIMPLQLNAAGVPTAYGVVLPVLSVSASGTTVTVTCSAVHNLQPGDQISALGLTQGNGFYTVAVPTATVFTYQTAQPVSPGLTSGTRIVTA